jgi:hypothetical protein
MVDHVQESAFATDPKGMQNGSAGRDHFGAAVAMGIVQYHSTETFSITIFKGKRHTVFS